MSLPDPKGSWALCPWGVLSCLTSSPCPRGGLPQLIAACPDSQGWGKGNTVLKSHSLQMESSGNHYYLLRARTSQGCSVGHRKTHCFLPAHFFHSLVRHSRRFPFKWCLHLQLEKCGKGSVVASCNTVEVTISELALHCLLPSHLSSAPSCVLWSFSFIAESGTAKSELTESSNYYWASSGLFNGNLPSPKPFTLLLP